MTSSTPPPRPARSAVSAAASATAAGADRRVHRRFEIRLAAEVVAPGKKSVTAVTRDLSRGGACLEGAHALPEDAMVEVALFVVVDGIEDASLPPLRVAARVQWCAQNDDAPIEARHVAGIQFAGLTDAQVDWLARFLPPET